MNLTLKIWRQKDSKSKGGFKTYEVKDVSPNSSFLEMLDVLNEDLVMKGEMPVNFDSDCREGICGACSLYVNGRPPGPDTAITICQVHMR
jgi:succinate dehydrogenase / fumarate reductase iron-sulfur subunit